MNSRIRKTRRAMWLEIFLLLTISLTALAGGYFLIFDSLLSLQSLYFNAILFTVIAFYIYQIFICSGRAKIKYAIIAGVINAVCMTMGLHVSCNIISASEPSFLFSFRGLIYCAALPAALPFLNALVAVFVAEPDPVAAAQPS